MKNQTNFIMNLNNLIKLLYFEVFAPNLANFLSRHKMMEIYPSNALNFIGNLTNHVIELRKSKQEVKLKKIF
jgi:hypothetical protein